MDRSQREVSLAHLRGSVLKEYIRSMFLKENTPRVISPESFSRVSLQGIIS